MIRTETIRARCTELSLTLDQVEVMGAASGYDGERALCWVLGLDPKSLQLLPCKNWADLAARSCSASYRNRMTPKELIEGLSSGVVPPYFEAHLLYFIEELPAQSRVLTIEQAARSTGTAICKIWSNLEDLHRRILE